MPLPAVRPQEQAIDNVMWICCYFRNLLFLKSYDGEMSELGLDFTVVNNELGEAQVDFPYVYITLTMFNLVKHAQLCQAYCHVEYSHTALVFMHV